MNRPTASTEWGHQCFPCWRCILKVLRCPRRDQSVGPQKGDPQTAGKSSNKLGIMQMRTLSSSALQELSIRTIRCELGRLPRPATLFPRMSIQGPMSKGTDNPVTSMRPANRDHRQSGPGSTIRRHVHATKKSTATTDLGKKGFDMQIILIFIIV